MSTVLVAEDDTVSRRIIVRAVNSLGHHTIETSNGETAWQILQDNPNIELIITDLMMPKLDGKALIQILKGNDNLKDLPIIMISGIVPLREISSILELGASRFMPKPVKTSDLVNYVKCLLNEVKELNRLCIIK
jgi:CheY-like chemotaxis protein